MPLVHRAERRLWPPRSEIWRDGGVRRTPWHRPLRHRHHARRPAVLRLLAGNYLGQIDLESGGVTVLEPPVPRQGARRVWSDSRGGLWITGWNSGDLFRYDAKSKTWAHWHLPGDEPQPYAVYVDETDTVWVSGWGANAILRFDPKTEKFEPFPLPDRYAGVRQLAGHKGEVWGAESGADKLFVLKAE